MKAREYKCIYCFNIFWGGGLSIDKKWVKPKYCPTCGKENTLKEQGDVQVEHE